MPDFSQRSRKRLETCHPLLVRLFERVVEEYDCTILEGHRGEEAQNSAFDRGTSQIRWPDGKHNELPSEAVDAAPYPTDWDDHDRFRVFAGYVLGMARGMGIEIRWGGDWDSDWNFKDQNFNDLPHFEILLPEAGP